MAKQDLLDQAAKLGIVGRSKMNVAQLEAAIAGAAKPKASSKKSKQPTPEELQEQRYQRTRDNREAEIAERAAGAAEAERLEREALAARRTGPQQALDRAQEES